MSRVWKFSLAAALFGAGAALAGCREHPITQPEEGVPGQGATKAPAPDAPPVEAAGERGTGGAGLVPSTDVNTDRETGIVVPGTQRTGAHDGTSAGAVGRGASGNAGTNRPGENQGEGFLEKPRRGADLNPGAEPPPDLRDGAGAFIPDGGTAAQ